jgi:deoxyribodipyrimidine photo-lyase
MVSSSAPGIVWLHDDLRLNDNPALDAALAAHREVLVAFIWAPEERHPWQPGAASRWWLHHSLAALDRSLRERGAQLLIRRGPSVAALRTLVRESGAAAVYWNRRYEPALIQRDREIKAQLRELGLGAQSFNARLLFEPWEVRNQSGNPYRVFTPYYRACLAKQGPAQVSAAPEQIPGRALASLPLSALELLPRINWARGFEPLWHPGEAGALRALAQIGAVAKRYPERRDRVDLDGTSRLSPHLAFGEIGPRQVLAALAGAGEELARQLYWREFAHHLLFHFPHTTEQPLREQFSRFPWRSEARELRAWQRGETGEPLVDAAMQQLWQSGFMHNRARMVAGSYLVKNLLQPWQAGARWFWDTLVDADLANNTLGWQWVAGCGADAAPYFRIFNPARQAARFDPDGSYRKQWRSPRSLAVAEPIVEGAFARKRALIAYDAVR